MQALHRRQGEQLHQALVYAGCSLARVVVRHMLGAVRLAGRGERPASRVTGWDIRLWPSRGHSGEDGW